MELLCPRPSARLTHRFSAFQHRDSDETATCCFPLPLCQPKPSSSKAGTCHPACFCHATGQGTSLIPFKPPPCWHTSSARPLGSRVRLTEVKRKHLGENRCSEVNETLTDAEMRFLCTPGFNTTTPERTQRCQSYQRREQKKYKPSNSQLLCGSSHQKKWAFETKAWSCQKLDKFGVGAITKYEKID